MRKLLSLFTALLFVGSMWGTDVYELTTTITDGEYVIGAIQGAAGANNKIQAIKAEITSDWGKYVTITPSNGKITDPSSSVVWTLTKISDNSFSLKNGTNYYKITTGKGSGSVSLSNTSSTIYFAAVGNSTNAFELSGVSSFKVSENKQLACNQGSGFGYRQYDNRTHETTDGGISTQIRFYKKANPTVAVKPTSLDFGNVSQHASVEAKTFKLKGAYLNSGITLSAPQGYTVSPESLTAQEAMNEDSVVINVTPVTTTADDFDGNLVIASAAGTPEFAAINVSLSMTVVPTYAINAEGEGGTITWTVGSDENPEYALAGSNVSVTATPDEFHTFASLALSENVTEKYIEGNEALFTMPAGNVTITAVFDVKTTPSVAVSENTLDWGRVKKGDELNDKTFTITGQNLSSALELDWSELGDQAFDYAVTGSLTPDGDKKVSATVTVTPKSTATAANLEDLLVISGGGLEDDVVIDAKLAVLELYTIRWNINGVEAKTTTDTAGVALVAPNTAKGVPGKIFVGWSEASIEGITNVEPTLVEYSTMPAKNATVYAVYAKGTVVTATWDEITSVPTDGTYAICSSSYFMKAVISSNRFANGSTPAISEGQLTEAPAADCQWEIEVLNEDTFTIRNEEDYAAGTGVDNKGALITSVTDYAKWKITYNNGFVFTNVGNAKASKNCTLRNNGSSGWAPYGATTGSAPRLFKQNVTEYNFSEYATNTYAVAFSAPTGGTMTIKKGNKVIASGDKFDAGQTLNVTIDPDATHTGGTIVVEKTSDHSDVTASVLSGTTLTVPAYDITVAATFIPTYAITLDETHCSIALKDDKDQDIADRATAGTVIIATATPEDVDYEFTSLAVSENVTNPTIVNNVASFEMPAEDVTVTSVYDLINSVVTITAPTGGSLSVMNDENPVTTGDNIAAKTSLTLTATPDETHTGGTIKVIKTGVLPEKDVTDSLLNGATLTMPNFAITISVEFEETFAVATTATNGSIALNISGRVVAGTAITATASPADQDYALTSLAVSENVTNPTIENNVASFEMPAGDVTVTAVYTIISSAVTFANPAHGTLTVMNGEEPVVTTDNIAAKTTLTVTATPTDVKKHREAIKVEKTSDHSDVTASVLSGNTLTMPNYAITILAVETPLYTITWNINGEETGQTDAEGVDLNIPDAGTLAGKVFVGWAEAAIDGQTDVEPAFINITKMPTADAKLYAVYATQGSEDQVKEFSYTITTSDFPGNGYDANDGDREVKAVCTSDATLKVDVEWTSYQMCAQSNKVQGKSNKGKVYNKSAWGRGVTSVTINGNSGFSKGIGSSEGPTSEGTGAFFQIKAGSSTSTATSITITFDSLVNTTTYSAYITNAYEVTFAAPLNGTLVVKNDENAIASGDMFPKNTVLTVEAEPASGYQLASLTANGVDIADQKSFTIGTADVEVVATFSQATALDNTELDSKAVKVMRNGILYIEKNGRTYNAQGQLIK